VTFLQHVGSPPSSSRPSLPSIGVGIGICTGAWGSRREHRTAGCPSTDRPIPGEDNPGVVAELVALSAGAVDAEVGDGGWGGGEEGDLDEVAVAGVAASGGRRVDAVGDVGAPREEDPLRAAGPRLGELGGNEGCRVPHGRDSGWTALQLMRSGSRAGLCLPDASWLVARARVRGAAAGGFRHDGDRRRRAPARRLPRGLT
jgi:hypothetical protein